MSDAPDKLKKTITLVMPNKLRMPKPVAAKVDALYKMREERLAYSRLVTHAKEKVLPTLVAREDEVARELAKELRKLGGATKLSGGVATFSPGETDVFTVTDWDAYHKYIKDNDAFELLERRPARGALKERLEDENMPNGVESDKKFTFSLVKASRK